jgi:hypothetical protein
MDVINTNGGSGWIIGFIGEFLIHSYNSGLQAITVATADFLTLQFTIAHALGFSVSTSRILATDIHTGTIT